MRDRREVHPAQLLGGVARDRAQRLVDLEVVAFEVGDRHPDRRVLERAPEALLRLGDLALALDALVDVLGDEHRADDLGAVAAQRARADPQREAVLGRDDVEAALLAGERGACRRRRRWRRRARAGRRGRARR